MGLFTQTKSVTTPATGYYAQRSGYRQLHDNNTKTALDLFYPNGQLNSSAFTPLAETADETRGFDMMRKGFTPTVESLSADLSMLMNPFDQYVVNDINKQAQGDYSLMRQYAGSAGQFGSNRDMLAASDVEQNRLNDIGKFRQSQYNTALDQTLNTLTGLRQQDANNLLGIGSFQRNLDYQTKQAPFNAYGAATGAMAPLYISGSPSQTVKVKQPSALGSIFSSAAPIIGSALGGPVGGAVGGALGAAATGGSAGDILSGGFSGAMGSGGFSSSALGGGGALGQWLGSLASRSPVGPYQPVTASFFR